MIRATIIIPMKFLKFSFDTPLFYIYGSIIRVESYLRRKEKENKLHKMACRDNDCRSRTN